MIKYADIIGESMVDGTGIRVTVFLQGCPGTCEGCHNPTLQNFLGGKEIQESDFAHMILKKVTPLHTGVTFSGGEPLVQQEGLFNVLTTLKANCPGLDIWVYTGYTFEEVKHMPLMKYVDVLVDGPFVLKKKDLSLHFRGSSNQRIIDVPQSLKKGEAVEIELLTV